MKLLKLDYDGSRNLTGVHILEGVSSGTAAEAPEEPEAPEALFSQPEALQSESKAAPERIPADLFSPQEAQQLLFICEQYLGKTLSSRAVSYTHLDVYKRQ